jgi:enoyl-CoA hydratase/carnithine racemase
MDTDFDDYRDRYSTIRMQRANGILELTFHTDGGPLRWGQAPHSEFGHAFSEIGRDPGNKVIIMTGTGDEFSGPRSSPETAMSETALGWDNTLRHGMQLTNNLLAIEAVVISCVNGPVKRHPEIPLLADIVLAAPEATFEDSAHFVNRMTPGDGVNFVFPLLLGINRARYFLLTGQQLDAAHAHELGLVAEIHERGRLLARARELATALARQNPLVLRYTRMLLMHRLRREAHDVIGYGLALEGLGVVAETQEAFAPDPVTAPPGRETHGTGRTA